MAEVIIRPKQPYPVFAGSMPSQRDGRRVNVIASVDQDSNWHVEKEDMGPEAATDAPILFVPFGGVDYALTMSDLREMMAGMRESHEKWREKHPTPDLTKRLKEYAEAIIHYRKGRKHFATPDYERGVLHGD